MPVQLDHVQHCWLGQIPYQQAWQLQGQLAAEIAAGLRPPTLLLLEHPHTITLGRSGSWDNLLWSKDQLRERLVSTFEADRGGDITYHGPGQLIGYPIIPLGRADANGRLPGPDYHGYLRRLERLLIGSLAHSKLQADVIAGLTGVWLMERTAEGKPETVPAKIGAIGIKVDSNGISQHGFSLNVNPDMTYFKGIIPCGIREHPVTSMAEVCMTEPSPVEVRQQIIRQFRDVFACDITKAEPDDILLSIGS